MWVYRTVDSILVRWFASHCKRELCYLLGITKNDIIKSRRDFILHRKCHGFGAKQDYMFQCQ